MKNPVRNRIVTPAVVAAQLGNVYLTQGQRDRALRSYSEALKYAPGDPQFRQPIQAQIQRV